MYISPDKYVIEEIKLKNIETYIYGIADINRKQLKSNNGE